MSASSTQYPESPFRVSYATYYCDTFPFFSSHTLVTHASVRRGALGCPRCAHHVFAVATPSSLQAEIKVFVSDDMALPARGHAGSIMAM